jgi:hypothetical protein
MVQDHGVNLADLDWIICHGGADIWHAKVPASGKEQPWVADEQYEQHIDFRYSHISRYVHCCCVMYHEMSSMCSVLTSEVFPFYLTKCVYKVYTRLLSCSAG